MAEYDIIVRGGTVVDGILTPRYVSDMQLAQKPALTLRYTKVVLTLPLKHLMQDMLGYGLALEGLGAVDLGAELSARFSDLKG